MSEGVVLRGRGLRHSYGAEPVLRGVDLEVHAGEVVALMGPSGSGKSTLLHLLGGLLTPDAGEVELLGRRIDHLSERQRSRLRLEQLGFVFQFGDLVPELTVVENVELPARLLGAKPRAARASALEMLERLDVVDLADRRLHEVSGGQSQRVAVAGHSRTGPRSCWPTSRPAPWTPSPARRCSKPSSVSRGTPAPPSCS